MAVLEIQGNGESSYVPQEAINSAIQLLEDPLQRVSQGVSALNCSIGAVGSHQAQSLGQVQSPLHFWQNYSFTPVVCESLYTRAYFKDFDGIKYC